MIERLEKLVREYRDVKNNNSCPVLQGKELKSLQNQIREISSKEFLTAAEANEINSILEDNLEWCS